MIFLRKIILEGWTKMVLVFELSKVFVKLLQNKNYITIPMLKEARRRIVSQVDNTYVDLTKNNVMFLEEYSDVLKSQSNYDFDYVIVNPHHAIKYQSYGYFEREANVGNEKEISLFEKIDFSDIDSDIKIDVKMNDYFVGKNKMSECSVDNLKGLYDKLKSVPDEIEVGRVPNYEYCAALKYFMEKNEGDRRKIWDR